jgi:spoIIIJ-associated protein
VADRNESVTGADADNSVVISAKTVDDAVAQALGQLGLTRDEVEVEVLHPGSPGRLLGFGAEPARVRVTPLVDSATDQARVLGLGDLIMAEADLEAGDEEEVDEFEDAAAVPSADQQAGEAEIARQMLCEVLDRMGLSETDVQLQSTNPITLDIRGGDVADLIGRRGETLRALQFLLNLMVSKQLRRHLRIVVDVDGYRARREELLRSMAQRFAQRVRATREAMQLETMPPNERRIVHLALAEDPDVFTESTGEGDSRRIVIRPRR